MKRIHTVAAVWAGGSITAAVIALMIYVFLVFALGPAFKNIDDAATKTERIYEMIAPPIALIIFIGGSIGSLILGVSKTQTKENE